MVIDLIREGCFCTKAESWFTQVFVDGPLALLDMWNYPTNSPKGLWFVGRLGQDPGLDPRIVSKSWPPMARAM